jgi:hypothetical protein
MPRYIVRLDDGGTAYYLEWSTIVDAPVTSGMTLDQFTTWYGEEYGRAGLEELPPRLERVNQTGVSRAWRGSTVDNLIRCNRAGKDETCLTREQIIDHYIRGNPVQVGTSDDSDDNGS